MRKISFAHKLSSGHKDIRHFELYEREDLNLDEEEFKKKVMEKGAMLVVTTEKDAVRIALTEEEPQVDFFFIGLLLT